MHAFGSQYPADCALKLGPLSKFYPSQHLKNGVLNGRGLQDSMLSPCNSVPAGTGVGDKKRKVNANEAPDKKDTNRQK